jgi:hypothetical protein
MALAPYSGQFAVSHSPIVVFHPVRTPSSC